jgi:hypothetical protein
MSTIKTRLAQARVSAEYLKGAMFYINHTWEWVYKSVKTLSELDNHDRTTALFAVKRDITVFKKVRNDWVDDRTIELILPADSLFWMHSHTDKCRASFAFVPQSAANFALNAFSAHNNNFKYSEGDILIPSGFNKTAFSRDECGTGIHFFFQRYQANDYRL